MNECSRARQNGTLNSWQMNTGEGNLLQRSRDRSSLSWMSRYWNWFGIFSSVLHGSASTENRFETTTYLSLHPLFRLNMPCRGLPSCFPDGGFQWGPFRGRTSWTVPTGRRHEQKSKLDVPGRSVKENRSPNHLRNAYLQPSVLTALA